MPKVGQNMALQASPAARDLICLHCSFNCSFCLTFFRCKKCCVSTTVSMIIYLWFDGVLNGLSLMTWFQLDATFTDSMISPGYAFYWWHVISVGYDLYWWYGFTLMWLSLRMWFYLDMTLTDDMWVHPNMTLRGDLWLDGFCFTLIWPPEVTCHFMHLNSFFKSLTKDQDSWVGVNHKVSVSPAPFFNGAVCYMDWSTYLPHVLVQFSLVQ